MSGAVSISWEQVERLTDRARSWNDVESHRLDLIAARRLRGLGRAVPERGARAEEIARIRAIGAVHLLQLTRRAYGGQIVVIKGPEAASAYPDPFLRAFVDVDLLVDDVASAHDALVAAGFEEAADPPWAARRDNRDGLFDDKHHSRPLQLPGIPLKLELHRRPNWPLWLDVPGGESFLSVAVPGSTGVDGVLALPAAHHAVVLAAHSWVDAPLGRLRDLLDVSLVAAGADRHEVEEVARSVGALHLWRSTVAAAECVFGDTRRTSIAVRTFARNLPAVRERTVFEGHLENVLSPFWSMPPGAAVRLTLSNLRWMFRPAVGESRKEKLARALRALAHAGRAKSAHDAHLGDEARQFHPRERWQNRPARRG